MAIIDSIVRIATQEWEYFGKQEFDLERKRLRKGRLETDEGYWQRVGLYWRDGTGKNLTGKNDDFPWSAAFISYVLRTAGAGDRFKYSAQHSVYIRRAVRARQLSDTSYGYWAHPLADLAPGVGDLICYAREPGITIDTPSANYKSHADLVVAVEPGVLKVIGGNVGNSVSLKHVRIGANGRVTDTHEAWFAVLSSQFDAAA